jgi:hypothetical protein
LSPLKAEADMQQNKNRLQNEFLSGWAIVDWILSRGTWPANQQILFGKGWKRKLFLNQQHGSEKQL